MKTDKIINNIYLKMKIEGILFAFVSIPFVLASINIYSSPYKLSSLSVLTSLLCFFCALFIFKHKKTGKFFAFFSLLGCMLLSINYVIKIPFAAFIASISFITLIFTLFDFSPNTLIFDKKLITSNIYKERVKYSAITLFFISATSMFLNINNFYFLKTGMFISLLITLCCFIHWSINRKLNKAISALHAIIVFVSISAAILSFSKTELFLTIFLSVFSIIGLLHKNKEKHERKENFIDFLINHPAKILFNTFLLLSIIGTFLLMIPASTVSRNINTLDAAFTAVSSVCVTGLTIKDTSNDFTFLGQFFILILIQLGGLGIMSIATIVLHTIGQRLSLKHERILSSMTDTNNYDLISSLITILKFTFTAEFLGSIFLFAFFYHSGDTFIQALWRGIFTSVSAFCNAGFALQSDSLISYQSNPFILYIVSSLIILGGMSPAASLLIFKWIRKKQIPIIVSLTLITTLILLILGTLLIIVFEWNNSLYHLSFMNKIHNAWFQSATLRTAGFNSINLSLISNPTFIIMLCFMFIGGSNGGTAGGIKTTTIAILIMTFWSNITNRQNITFKNRKIPSNVIFRAVTIFISGLLILFIIIIMLETTQQISAKLIIFEAFSALGTVGLSLGATSFLDEVGKIIIMFAMFIGRIGPITLFMIISEDFSKQSSYYPEAKITLT